MPWIYDLRKDLRFKEGIREGMKDKAHTSAVRMLKHGGLTIAKIAEYLDMPVSLVLKIQKELEKNPNLKEKY